MARRPAGRFAATHAGITLLVVVAAAAAGPAAAAEEAEAEAETTAQPPEPLVPVPEVVARALRPGELPDDPSSFSTVIDPADYAGEAKSVEELLARSVGVQVRRFGGPGQSAEISIRGSTSSQVVILLDGVRLNTAQSGAVDLSSVPLSIIQRIEVSRGGGSAQAGSDAIGGVVNLVTKRTSEARLELASGAGSFGTYQGSALRAQRAGPLELLVSYDGFKTDGDWRFDAAPAEFAGGSRIEPEKPRRERINNRSESHVGLAKLGLDLGERMHVSLQESLYFVSRGQPGLDTGVGVLGGQSATAHERRTRNVAALRLETSDLGLPGLETEARLEHRYERTRFRDEMPVFGTPVDVDDENQSLGASLRAARGFDLAGARHLATLRLDWRRDALRSNDFESTDRHVFGVFVQDQLDLFGGALRLVPALRLDDTEGFGRRYVPRVGLVVTPWPWLRVKANLERSYRVPSFDELFFPDKRFLRGNPNLDAEDARNADAGLELRLARAGPLRDLRFEAVVFHNDIEESIAFVLINSFTVAAQNLGDASATGIEVSAAFDAFDWLRVSANTSYLDSELDATGEPLPGRARNETSVRLELRPFGELAKLALEAHHTGRIPVSESGRTVLLSRTVYDAAVSLNLARAPLLRDRLPWRDLFVSLTADNVFDRAVRDAQFFPQPGRTVLLRIDAAF